MQHDFNAARIKFTADDEDKVVSLFCPDQLNIEKGECIVNSHPDDVWTKASRHGLNVLVTGMRRR